MPRLLCAALAAGLAAALGCAKQGRPTGGPVDRTAPVVVSHQPAPDATGVDRGQAVTIEFSEAMDRGRTEEAVFLAPRSDFEAHWRERRLRITIPGGLAEERTYVVTVGTDARDLRGNGLEQSFQLAFATGGRLDAGSLSGSVLAADLEPQRGAFVWAYDMALFDGRTGVDPPDYVTQSGAGGGFRFDRLASSRYRTIAFVDGNRNQRPDPGEPLALPHDDRVASTDGEADGAVLVLAARDPEVRVQRISAVDRRRILLVFERPVDAAGLVVEMGSLDVQQIYAHPTDPRRIYAVTAEQQPGRTYRPTVRLAGHGVEVPREPVRGTDREDRGRPEVVGLRPQGLTVEADSLVLTFSEAMDTSAVPSMAARDTTSAPPPGRWRWTGPLSLAFTPEPPLEPGAHRLEVELGVLRDRAGNAPQDSTALLGFELLAAADRASVEGKAGWPAASGPVQVRLRQPGGPALRADADSAGLFAFPGIAPGTYRLSAFVDRDGDGEHGIGRLDPYAPAEPIALGRELVLERGQSLWVEVPEAAPAP